MDTIRKNFPITRLLQICAMGFCLIFSSNLLAVNYYAGVFEFQKKLANNGNPQAQYKLASMYEKGHGVKKNTQQAKHWYKKSAANNYKMAGLRLTYLEVKQNGFKKNHRAWLNNVKQEAKKGNPEALFLAGELYEEGTAVKKDLYQAKRYYKKASSKGNVDSETRLFEVEEKIAAKEKQKKASALAAKQENLKNSEAEKQKQAKEQQAREELARQKEKLAQANNEKKAAQLKLEQERKRLKIEKERLAAEKRKLEIQRKIMEEEALLAAEEEKVSIEDDDEIVDESEDNFEADLCSGRAARFRTQCK